MLEILLRTGAKTAAGGEHNRDEKGIALIMLNNSRDRGQVRRSFSSITTVVLEKTAAATWVSGSLTFKPHGARSTLPRTETCASAWPVPQRMRRSRMTFCSATSPGISSWSAGSLIPIPTSRRTCRRGALIALLWRIRMPLEAPPGALSHFLLVARRVPLVLFSSSPLLRLWLFLAFAQPLLPLASEFLYHLPFAPLCGYCPFLFSHY